MEVCPKKFKVKKDKYATSIVNCGHNEISNMYPKNKYTT
jgi:hypothetical protein